MVEIKVEIAFDSSFSSPMFTRLYDDVSAWVEGSQGINISYGRSDELSTPSPSTCSLTLDNRDGRFTPERAASPYYPEVKKGKPIIVSVRYAGVWYTRFTGYVDEWPVTWPDGSNAVSQITISCSSRRARLGRGAPLPSAIRAAYLATSPTAYWPMDEDAEVVDRAGSQAFRDITNTVTGGVTETETIAAFAATAPAPVVRDGTQGPTDEGSLVKLPSYSNAALLGTFPHYVGGGDVFKINTSGSLTVEVVARIVEAPSTSPVNAFATVLWLASRTQAQVLQLFTLSATGHNEIGTVNLDFSHRVPSTWALDADAYRPPLGAATPEEYAAATDGQMHHYALAMTGGNTVKYYFDGVLKDTLTLPGGVVCGEPFTQIVIGAETLNTTLWVGHAAVHNRALSPSEVLTHANAATAATETTGERVTRIASYMGIPSAEVAVEASVAPPLGAQPEKGRPASEVLDEVATSTGGVMYDSREGLLVLQARNHRYNAPLAFTLSAVEQEIEGDLATQLDDRYLVNEVEFSRSGSDSATAPAVVSDQASINDHGLYRTSIQIVSSSDNEVASAASNMLAKYAQPTTRISNVAVDVVNAPQRAAVLAADIGTRFGISGLPVQAPADSMYLFLEGYTEAISTTSHTLTMNTTPAPDAPGWVLGDAVLSNLGSTTYLVY